VRGGHEVRTRSARDEPLSQRERGRGEGRDLTEHLRVPLPTVTRHRAREHRVCSTDAERTLWFHLRAGRLNGVRFRRQHPIPPYIVELYCEAAKLVIELDGSQHNPEADAARTRFLKNQGLTLLRFWDNDLLQQTESVLEAILSAVGPRPLTPAPLPKGEGSTQKSPP